MPGKKAGSENNEVDYNSRHPEPLARQEDHDSSRQAEFKLRETEGEFEREIITARSSCLARAATTNTCRHRTFEPDGGHR